MNMSSTHPSGGRLPEIQFLECFVGGLHRDIMQLARDVEAEVTIVEPLSHGHTSNRVIICLGLVLKSRDPLVRGINMGILTRPIVGPLRSRA